MPPSSPGGAVSVPPSTGVPVSGCEGASGGLTAPSVPGTVASVPPSSLAVACEVKSPRMAVQPVVPTSVHSTTTSQRANRMLFSPACRETRPKIFTVSLFSAGRPST
jgi:hypothetical protein